MERNNRFEYMSDAELKALRYRAIGWSTRIIDHIIQDFFDLPMGTKIYISDHYLSRRADDFLCERVMKRLDNEHHMKVKRCVDNGGVYLVREEPTLHELVEEEIKRREEND
jgi:hypothetical protein